MFYNVRTISPEKRPSLAREKVLLVHDVAAGREHFVRELVFRKAEEPFGFVVPTPSRPEVAKVDKTPFSKLRERFPFAPLSRGIGTGSGYGKGAGGGGGGGVSGVQVLATEKVGSFTAFVLAATDAEGLATWLRDNELGNGEQTQEWLEHYVAMKFFYVAMRYDPPADGKSGPPTLAAETTRSPFDTPVAYYPYVEPRGEGSTRKPRLLELWTVSSTRVVPVTRKDEEGWVRPFKPGREYARRATLDASLADELESLLPEGDLVVQTFWDQKRSRAGFHDVLFASAESREFSPDELAALEPLLGILDPGLIPPSSPAETAEDAP